MTPQLQQAIKLLQLSNLELISFVETELERNPLLQRADADEPNGMASDSSAAPLKEEQPDKDRAASEGETEAGDEGSGSILSREMA